MSNSFYTHGAFPSTGSAATSASMRAELDLISAGFDKMPTLSGNANLFVVINSTGTGLTQTSSLPSATFTDTLFTIQDDGDNTRKFQFNASTVTPGATRIYSVPDANTTLVGTDTTQTLTNKTLTAPVISSIVNTGSLSLPTSTDTLVGRATTDTLTNKTLTSPVIATIVNTGTLTLPTSTDTLVGRATTDTLTNKTLTSPVIATIVNTGTLTLPTSTDTLVGRATTDTLTNKTLTSPVIATIVNTGTLTLPTSTDTLVGRATTDTLTNKTLTSPVIGTIVNTGTLTLPTSTDTLVGRATTDTLTNKTLGAFTISGTVSGGGNQINNVIIGASTPLAGSFTTLSTTGLASLPSTGRSAAAALTVTNPAFLYGVASTYTDTASSGVIAAMAPFYSISGPTLSTSNVTTYTNSATLYIANAPTAGGSATITNPYSLYINAGAAYFGGAVTFAGSASLAALTVTSLTNSGLTSGRVVYSTTGGLETDSANLTFNGTTLTANTIGAFTLSGTIAGGGNQINNVIIGTTTPLAGAFTTLSATGVATFSAGSAAAPAITTTGDTNTGIFFPAADTIAFAEGGAEAMRIDSSGNVGIGTSTVGAKLDLQGSAIFSRIKSNVTTYNGFRAQNDNGNFYFGLDDASGGFYGSANARVLYADGAYPMVFYTNAVERMRLDSSGVLLLGTSSSNSVGGASGSGSLQVETPNAAANISVARNTNNSAPPSFFFGKSRGAALGGRTIVASGDFLGQIVFSGTDGTNYIQAATISASVDGTPGTNDMPGRLVFSTTADGSSSPTERMRLDSSGNLGIGVTPAAWTNSFGVIQGLGGWSISNTSASNSADFLSNAYRSGGANSFIYLGTANATRYQQATGQHVWYNAASGTAGNAITFTQAMTLDSSGNLGIGTSSPGYALDVQKSVSSGVLANFQSTNTAAVYTGIAFRSAATNTAARNWSLTMNNNAFGDFAIRTSTAINGDPIAAGTDRLVINASGDITASTGNIIQGTAAKGINFTANTATAGSTSQLLNWYEEGTWTPVIADATSGGNLASAGTTAARYTRIGRTVFVQASFDDITTTGMTAINNVSIRGLPFASAAGLTATGTCVMNRVSYAFNGWRPQINPSVSLVQFTEFSAINANLTTMTVANILASGLSDIYFSITYTI